ncbi:SDR family NAD(P)-dependent oxidoreductase [Amycolatopsis taiwanensis]|uniref:Short chain dehydrogenase n=1 Tax=Amycolatopsis taiwanensis TaxID=342230 RepID=A0A9W6RB48_9PSEU|nr:SDR family NAD(P)-dependent oxidoreductase [Amycolatopsis taiwanensis]GLY71505.1 short chain dehydrogenase [Amycolatopsis taiwanensis]
MTTAPQGFASLSGKVAIVTGAGSGIGAASAATMAAQGARVCCADINPETAERTAKDIVAAGGEAFALRVDVAAPEDNDSMVSTTVARYGAVHIAHLNAAAMDPDSAQPATVLDFSLKAWDSTMAVNLRGVMLGMRAAGRAMRDAGGGSIVVTSSAAGLIGVRMASAYSASKHGVLGLVKTAALELGPVGIRVNAICPGYIASNDFMRKMGEERNVGSRFPLGRVGRAEDVANLAAFLASDSASFISGSVHTIDGGWLAGPAGQKTAAAS